MCSAAETTVDSGALATTMPRRVAASTSTLSIPTPARPITFSRRRPLDQLRGQLRRRADDDAVVAVDDLGEIATRRRRRRRSARGGARLRRPRSPRGRGRAAGGHTRASARTPRAPPSRRRRARSSAPSSTNTSSTAASTVVMSKMSNQPMWPSRKILPEQLALAVRDRDAEPVAERADDVGRVDARRRAHRRDDGAPVLVGREQLETHRLHARAAARPRRTCRSKAASRPSSSSRPSATSSAATSETAGVNGASCFACALRVRSQSK